MDYTAPFISIIINFNYQLIDYYILKNRYATLGMLV